MKHTLTATLPLALVFGLAACGEPIDGSDTADLGSDVTSADPGPEGGPEYEPGEDGLLQSDMEPDPEAANEPAAEPIAGEESMADDPVDPAYPAE
jgi:hypothetical protein